MTVPSFGASPDGHRLLPSAFRSPNSDVSHDAGAHDLVSVVIPAYNRGDLLRRALASVMSQSWRPVEAVVVDDGSEEDLGAVVAEFGGVARMVRQANSGVTAARNRGMEEARGEFIAFLDSDDWWDPWKISAQVALLRARPDVVMTWTDMRAVDEFGAVCAPPYLRTLYSYEQVDAVCAMTVAGPLGTLAPGCPAAVRHAPVRIGNMFADTLYGNLVHASTVLVRRTRLVAGGDFGPTPARSGEDYAFHRRNCLFGPVALIEEAMVSYGIGAAERLTSGKSAYQRAWNAVTGVRYWLDVAGPVVEQSPRDVRRQLAELERGCGGPSVLYGGNGGFRHPVPSLRLEPLGGRNWVVLVSATWPRVFRERLLPASRSRPVWARGRQWNDLIILATLQGFRVSAVAAGARVVWEEAAAASGVPLAVSDLELWRAMGFGPGSTFCVIHDRQGKLAGGFAVQHWPSHALPGHCILRLETFGESVPLGAEPAAVAAVQGLAQRMPRLLRVVVELHDRDAERRARIADALRAAGFYRKDRVRTYDRTLAIDLQRGDQALLASFSPRARRLLRRAEHLPLSVISIEDDVFVPQLVAIQRETFARTGMQAPAQPWTQLITAARKFPSRLRILGVMLTDQHNAGRLIAFVRVLRHGTFVEYNAAGSTRLEDRRIPLTYPAIWEALRWARDTGATWFDFGGVTPDTPDGNDDPLAGISEFKRNFGGEELAIGEDWQFDVAPLRQRLAQWLGRTLTELRSGRS